MERLSGLGTEVDGLRQDQRRSISSSENHRRSMGCMDQRWPAEQMFDVFESTRRSWKRRRAEIPSCRSNWSSWRSLCDFKQCLGMLLGLARMDPDIMCICCICVWKKRCPKAILLHCLDQSGNVRGMEYFQGHPCLSSNRKGRREDQETTKWERDRHGYVNQTGGKWWTFRCDRPSTRLIDLEGTSSGRSCFRTITLLGSLCCLAWSLPAMSKPGQHFKIKWYVDDNLLKNTWNLSESEVSSKESDWFLGGCLRFHWGHVPAWQPWYTLLRWKAAAKAELILPPTQPPLRSPSQPPSGQPELLEGHGPIERIGSTGLTLCLLVSFFLKFETCIGITGGHLLQDLQLMLLGTQDMVDVGQWGAPDFLQLDSLFFLEFSYSFLDMPAFASSFNPSIAKASDSAAVDKAPDSAANLGAAVSQEPQRIVSGVLWHTETSEMTSVVVVSKWLVSSPICCWPATVCGLSYSNELNCFNKAVWALLT